MSFGMDSAETLEVFVRFGTVSLGVLNVFREESLLAPLKMWTVLGLGRDFFLVSVRTLMFSPEASVGAASLEALVSVRSLMFSPEASAGEASLETSFLSIGLGVSGSSLRVSSRTLVSSSETSSARASLGLSVFSKDLVTTSMPRLNIELPVPMGMASFRTSLGSVSTSFSLSPGLSEGTETETLVRVFVGGILV